MAQHFQSVDDVKRHFGALKSAVLTKLFDLPAEAAGVNVSMDASVKARLGYGVLDKVRNAQRQGFVSTRIEATKSEYIRLELEEAEVINAMSEEADKVLTPREASPESILQAATLTEEQIIMASEVARTMGEAGEDACLVLLRASIETDLDQATYDIAAFYEEWELVLAVLAEAGQSLDLDEEEVAARFDAMVPRTATNLLGEAHGGHNISGMTR